MNIHDYRAAVLDCIRFLLNGTNILEAKSIEKQIFLSSLWVKVYTVSEVYPTSNQCSFALKSG